MDEFTRHINEMNDCLQSFSKNNRILADNWKDEQSDRFSSSILNEMTRTTHSFVQHVENGRTGIESLVRQLEEMEKELTPFQRAEMSYEEVQRVLSRLKHQ